MAEPIEPVSYRDVTLTDYLGAGLAHVGFALLRLLPFAAASNAGGFLARTIGPLLGKSNVARKNLKAAFPELSDIKIEALVRECWDTLGRAAFEFPLMDRLLLEPDRARVEIEGREHLDAALNSGKPLLFFGAHLGSWELMPVSAALLGFTCHIFYRAPNNPLLLKLFTSRKAQGELIPKGARGAKRAFALLKKGENLGILVDQKLNDGIAVPFFGRDAMTSTVLAEFALRFDAPMIPIRCTRLPGVRFKLSYGPPLEIHKTDDRKADVKTIMTAVNAMMESWIRENPGQWLWLHNRWPD
ncbi:MAG: lauroyl acyltransferase [Rhodospirillales bacterium]|nr:lauroyl acyltransferase [Rhodospirillales bacterium]